MPVSTLRSTERRQGMRRARLALGASINLLGLACLVASAAPFIS
ncbi:MAG: hypothetical protein V4808_04495 [Pseudomonadota bacterium]